jgi:cytochrome c-type biogenesis protein CcmF
LLSLAVCVIGAFSGIAGGVKRSDSAWKWARICAYIAALSMTLAMGLMEYALITNDFSVSYVAKVGSTTTPLWVTIVSLWSSLEGSILLWAFVLNGYIALFAWTTKDKYVDHSSYALGASLCIAVFFSFLIAGVADPFVAMDPVPTEGPGPNPLLQNHILMVIHPPALYLGYVGMAVPFGMGVAALLAGKIGAAWSTALRRWILLPWGFLTIGIILGGWWSYEVLGWGGYWAWDPVENASFLPWLTATAFIHSALIMERKDGLKGWGIVLLLVTFLLTLLGTFMTRSGVFNSVHSFTQTPIGPVFLGFLGLCSFVSLVLLSTRIDVLGSQKKSVPMISRDSMFLLNNLLFAAFTFTVLIGTVYPLIHEAMTEKKLSIGEPYFNELGILLSIVIVFLMGVGPALPWGHIEQKDAAKRLMIPIGGAVVSVLIALSVGATGFTPLLSFGVCGFALMTTLRELIEPAKVRVQKKSEPWPNALWTVWVKTRRRTGGYIVHIGVIMIAVAITGSGAFKDLSEVTLKEGQSVQIQEYQLTYVGKETIRESHRQSEIAKVSVLRGNREIGILEPKLNNYFRMGSVIGTPAVHNFLDEDLYLNLVNMNEDGSIVGLQVITQPLVLWLWVGGGFMMIGTLISSWPSRKRRKDKRLQESA